jgi:hypothetical protein
MPQLTKKNETPTFSFGGNHFAAVDVTIALSSFPKPKGDSGFPARA